VGVKTASDLESYIMGVKKQTLEDELGAALYLTVLQILTRFFPSAWLLVTVATRKANSVVHHIMCPEALSRSLKSFWFVRGDEKLQMEGTTLADC
jgi:hypothetical protein